MNKLLALTFTSLALGSQIGCSTRGTPSEVGLSSTGLAPISNATANFIGGRNARGTGYVESVTLGPGEEAARSGVGLIKAYGAAVDKTGRTAGKGFTKYLGDRLGDDR